MKDGLAIVGSGLVEEARISVQERAHHLRIPKLHGGEEPVLLARPAAQPLPHLLASPSAVAVAAAGGGELPPLCTEERWWPGGAHCASSKSGSRIYIYVPCSVRTLAGTEEEGGRERGKDFRLNRDYFDRD